MSEEIKLCPFCGEYKATVKQIRNYYGKYKYYVLCKFCYCSIGLYLGSCFYAFAKYDSEEAAIKAWNIRKE